VYRIFFIFKFLRFYENKLSDSTLAELATNRRLKRRLDTYRHHKQQLVPAAVATGGRIAIVAAGSVSVAAG
jgi:hypothetical protein